ncbi:hypothetical protein, conserved [Trypanosoma brucei gambiense DAL972]|uniref:Uncharacterized protein n=2 Tax=Trypanosoma brucei TaxID=5691 RepID=C9ZLB1_TRYB9|nr:hypothetical protein, conserved [Trypanosoma brucei gambiense DAL972]RHW73437.1 Integral membrane protein S linking to the trans Golgi network [Trypanosoma brucei equiperdum]CBH10120.1 hypothetical protein, conserved [Trypanosoma brucei gambiense DAL972]|eukprot:XP_011772410.1 hypothetical protein, conserved [Trypanosoma brucei gambiense DAL972]
MAIPLGASLSDPRFVSVQILHVVSAFFLIMAMVRVALGVLLLLFSHSENISYLKLLSRCFHIPLRSLFMVHVEDMADGSASRFFFMHVMTALVVSYPLAHTIQRRKFALDFAFTTYAIYFFFCCLVGWRVTGGGFAWWLSVVSGFGITCGMTAVICRRCELQDIILASSPVTSRAVGGNGAYRARENVGNPAKTSVERSALLNSGQTDSVPTRAAWRNDLV